MTSAAVEGPAVALDPQERLGELLADIEALQAELQTLEGRLAQIEARPEDVIHPERAHRADHLAQRIADELLLRGRQAIAAAPQPAAADRRRAPVRAVAAAAAPAHRAPTRPATVAGSAGVGVPVLDDRPQPAVVAAPERPEVGADHGAPTGADGRLAGAVAPGELAPVPSEAPERPRSWARPAEIVAHVALLGALLALALGAFR